MSYAEKKRTSQRRVTGLKIGSVAVAFAVLPAILASGYLLRVATLLITFTLFAIALNIVFGHTDQLFLCVGGLAGIGGYTTVITANVVGVTPWVTIPLGALLAGIVGMIISFIAAKYRFTVVIIAIFTIAFQLALTQFFTGARWLTQGSTGIPIDNTGIEDPLVFYYLFVAVLVVFLVGYHRLINSHYGMAFSSIRQDELAAESVGIKIVRYKAAAGFLGSVMFGLVGALYALSEGYISPSVYSFQNIDVMVLIILTVGSMRTLLGPIVGAVIIIAIEETLAATPEWRLVIFGVSLIILFLYFREGIVLKITNFLEEQGIDVDAGQLLKRS